MTVFTTSWSFANIWWIFASRDNKRDIAGVFRQLYLPNTNPFRFSEFLIYVILILNLLDNNFLIFPPSFYRAGDSGIYIKDI